jgi:hypothetical protein
MGFHEYSELRLHHQSFDQVDGEHEVRAPFPWADAAQAKRVEEAEEVAKTRRAETTTTTEMETTSASLVVRLEVVGRDRDPTVADPDAGRESIAQIIYEARRRHAAAVKAERPL